MNAVRSFARLVLVLACAGLAGCVSVFPKTHPSQLYRFGGPSAVASSATPPADAKVVALGSLDFPDEAATDRILTTDGVEAAYIKGARWVSPAPVLFEDAMVRAFEAPGAPRLVAAAGVARAALILTVRVQSFETRYDSGPSAPPEVVVQLRAQLLRPDNRTVAADRILTSTARASENRVGAIVHAYDQAVADVLAKLVDLAGSAT